MDAFCVLGDWSVSFEMIGQFFYILLLLGAFFVLARFLKKRLSFIRFGVRGKKNIQVIETCALGAQNAVSLVRVGDKYCLLGISKEQIRFLTEVDASHISGVDTNEADERTTA